ncbi:MAG: hypothetical protein EXR51_07875 [Dehalococcoidia bacterium]|nr:hypothetical protein [Dehalococcoidia bacterium]
MITFDFPANWTVTGEHKNNIGLLSVGAACKDRFQTEVPRSLRFYKLVEQKGFRQHYGRLESYLATSSSPQGVARTNEAIRVGSVSGLKVTTQIPPAIPENEPGTRVGVGFFVGQSLFVFSADYSDQLARTVFDRMVNSMRVSPK